MDKNGREGGFFTERVVQRKSKPICSHKIEVGWSRGGVGLYWVGNKGTKAVKEGQGPCLTK